MSIPDHILDQLNSQADLVSIIGKHVALKRSGNSYKGCCPFHQEKTPSFYITPSKGLYHCFGCKAGGNALNFLIEYEGLSFLEAVEELSKQTGIDIPKQAPNPQLFYNKTAQATTPAQTESKLETSVPSEQVVTHTNHTPVVKTNIMTDGEEDLNNFIPVSEYENNQVLPTPHPTPSMAMASHDNSNNQGNLYDLLNQLADYYQQQLKTNPRALLYLSGRGLTEASLQTFGLGYAPDGWQHLQTAFSQDIAGLKTLGLIRSSDSGRDYCLLRDRIIFTIKDHKGRIVGFAGRTLSNDVQPKYINSPESVVFQKQQILYGLYESRNAKANRWLVVEGYMDVISLYQAGIYGAVASMGTATNANQLQRLLTSNPALTLCFDGDNAGQQAAWRTLELALPLLTDERELNFLTLPNNADPDSFVKEQGATAMLTQLDQATPLSDYIFAKLSQQTNINTPEGKGKLIGNLRKLTELLPQKGSYRWLLKDDIYKRLGLGKHNQAKATQDALLNFHSELTISLQLQLSFLFNPYLVEPNSIQTIYSQAGATQISLAKTPHTETQPPKLPTWYDISDAELYQIIQLILANQSLIPQAPNEAAHFVLAALPDPQQHNLIKHWQAFYTELIAREVFDLSQLVHENLFSLLIDYLNKYIQTQNSMVIKDYLTKQRNAIIGLQKLSREKNTISL